jgi:hypothetical protein
VQWRAVVIAVHDGDSLTVREESGPAQRVRLEGIDAPELRQPLGLEARDVLIALTLHRSVEVHAKGRDRYGRLLARVIADGKDVSEAMVERGLAWHFTPYSDDPKLAALEREARRHRVGLWRDSHPMAPGDFRSGAITDPKLLGPLHGNVRSHVVHGPTCPEYTCANCKRTFATLRDALGAGYRAHRQCLRQQLNGLASESGFR